MHIALLCATRRGKLVLEKLIELLPKAQLTVFSFREDPWEPAFFEDIKGITLDHGGNFIEAKQVGNKANLTLWESTEIDIALVVSWRYLIPPTVYHFPRIGTFVFHDSMLPAYRGFSPTVWAMINGEDHTGVTLFEIAEEVDAGDIIDQEMVPIAIDESIGVVLERVTQTYLRLLEVNLQSMLNGSFTSRPQDHTNATFTCKRVLEDNQIDWTAPAEKIYNLIRALSRPYPGAYTYCSGERLRVWSARLMNELPYIGRIPGRLVQVIPGKGTVVLCGDGALLLQDVQKDEGQIECAANILNRPSITLGR